MYGAYTRLHTRCGGDALIIELCVFKTKPFKIWHSYYNGEVSFVILIKNENFFKKCDTQKKSIVLKTLFGTTFMLKAVIEKFDQS